MCLPMSTCCCCISLESGTQIISIVSTLLSTLLAVLYGFAAVLPKQPESRVLFYGAMTVTATCHAFAGLCLIYGAFWTKPRCMWPWIIMSWSWSILLLLASIAGFGLLHYSESDVDDEVNYVMSAYIIFSGITYYLASIVNSRRRELQCGQMYSGVKTNSPIPSSTHIRTYSMFTRYV